MNAPANDTRRLDTRDAFAMSLKLAFDNHPMSVCFDEMVDCTRRRDNAGYAAAKRIFERLQGARR